MKSETSNLMITTAVLSLKSSLEQNRDHPFTEESNKTILQLILKLLDSVKDTDLLILPGGIFYFDTYDLNRILSYFDPLIEHLEKRNDDLILTFGFDSDHSKDQMGIALNKNGIQAIARKFHPTNKGEEQNLNKARDYLAPEQEYSRTFKVKDKWFYLGVCYDCFGPAHLDLRNPEVDGAIVLVHDFYKHSGYVDFARKGFAGLSKQWQVPVYASAHFWDIPIPVNWPTGLYNGAPEKSTLYFKYSDNTVAPLSSKKFSIDNIDIELRSYLFES